MLDLERLDFRQFVNYDFNDGNEGKQYNVNQVFELLLPHYHKTINKYVHKYFSWGGDKEDLYQQGMIGLYNAILAYNPIKGGNFSSLASKCIKLNILNLVRADNAKKRLVHYQSSSLDKTFESMDGNDTTLLDLIHSKSYEPLELIICQESVSEIENTISLLLSPFEQNVFESFIEGKAYDEIASGLSVSCKSVDNAMQRIKRKLRKSISRNSK